MKALLLSALLACTLAAPQSAPPTKRAVEYPEHAEIQVVSNRGPGCPIQSTDRRVSVVDYMWGTLSENEAKTDSIWRRALNLPFTMTPSAWYEGYGDNDRWCEHTWKFTNSSGYRLTVNKNGTEIIAQYRMGEGTSVVWKVTYYAPDGTELVDEIVVNGPIGGPYSSSDFALPKDVAIAAGPPKSYKTGCGEDDKVIKMKIQGKVEGKQWAQVWGGNHNDYYNRVMQVFSYSWEKC